MAAMSGRVPRMFDAPVTATTRVLSLTRDSTSSGVRMPVPGSNSAHRTVAPERSAYVTQGRTLPSWSSRVTTTSSPGPQPCASVRATWNVSSVMLRPNTMPGGVAVHQVGAREARADRDVVGVALGLRRAPAVGQSRHERAGDGGGHDVGGLGAAGPVEVGGAVGEGGDAGAEAIDVVGHEDTSHQMVATSRGTGVGLRDQRRRDLGVPVLASGTAGSVRTAPARRPAG